MSVFGLTQGWQRQPWAKTGERPRRYIPWAGTGERRRRYIRLGWNGRTPKALHTLGLELANADGVRNSGLTRLHTNFPLHQLKALGVLRDFDGPAEAFFYVGGHCVCRFGFAVGEKGPTWRRGLHPLQPVQHFFPVRMRGEAADLCHATTYRNPLF